MSTEEERTELIEQMRWREQQYTFVSVALWESRRGEKWLTPDSRNHQITETGMTREVRANGPISIEDDDVPTLTRLVEGRTIVKFEREPNSGVDWTSGENSVTLILDDGSRLEFWGWGYDASGCETTYSPAESGASAGLPELVGELTEARQQLEAVKRITESEHVPPPEIREGYEAGMRAIRRAVADPDAVLHPIDRCTAGESL